MARCARLLLLSVLLLSGVRLAAAQEATPESAAPLAEPVELRVMTFNVWLGGIQVDIAKVVEAIQAADADVVGLQEGEANAQRIADALGWQYVDNRSQVISRLPLIDPSGGDGAYIYVEPTPGRVIAFANLHLPSDPYGPELVRDGATMDEIMANEAETRMPVAQRYLDALPAVIDAGIPVVLTGDFNSPSHLDWTAEAAAARGVGDAAIEWPVSLAFTEIGFRDAYRAANPDPVAAPGLTWTPGYPHPLLRDGETHDRIDWILVAGNVETVSSTVVGEPGGADVGVAVSPWPSDHRGVVATLRVQPVSPPRYVAVGARSVEQGDPIVVRYHANGVEGERVAIVRDGATADAALMSLPPQESFETGAMMFGSATLEPGAYAALLLDETGAEVARTPFWVTAPGAAPELVVAEPTALVGEPIEVAWTNGPGYKWDWLGVYAAGDPDLYNYLGYAYVDALPAGSKAIDESWFGAPLEPGDYEVRLMRDDGYVVLAVAAFSVVAE